MMTEVDISGVRLETERLVLRPWEQKDLMDFFQYASVDGVGQMAGWEPHESLEKSQMILDMFIRERKVLALELKENGKVIGSLGIEDRAEELPDEYANKSGRDLGYALSREYWGRGLMPEAVKAVIDYCFRELHFDFLTCGHFVWNSQSRRVIEKCGFIYDRNITFTTRKGTVEDTCQYILNAPEKR